MFSSLKAAVALVPELVVVQRRAASHSVLSSKRVIPPPPKQPQPTYEMNYNTPGGLFGWTDFRMKKDARKRRNVEKWGAQWTLLASMRRTTILPREIKVNYKLLVCILRV